MMHSLHFIFHWHIIWACSGNYFKCHVKPVACSQSGDWYFPINGSAQATADLYDEVTIHLTFSQHSVRVQIVRIYERR